jgi:hypothetical protein
MQYRLEYEKCVETRCMRIRIVKSKKEIAYLIIVYNKYHYEICVLSKPIMREKHIISKEKRKKSEHVSAY